MKIENFPPKVDQSLAEKLKIIAISVAIFVMALFSYKVFAFWKGVGVIDSGTEMSDTKKIMFSDENLSFDVSSKAGTVEEFLREQGIELEIEDSVSPDKNTKIYSGTNITIQRAKKVIINADGNKLERYTFFERVENVLKESNVTLNEVDIVSPPRTSLVTDGTEIKVTRVDIEEKTVKKNINFKTITETDDKLGWREKKIKQKGEKGLETVIYKIIYHNGKELSREILKREIVKESIAEIMIQGTLVKTGKVHKGQGTWYSFKSGLFAASPWLPLGSFAKVTNQENGKSIIVQINDRGPFGKGRIIDLDKVAFAKIGSIDAGVIGVKVEEILN